MTLRNILAGLDALGRPLGQESSAETPRCRQLLGLWLRALGGVGRNLIEAVAVARVADAGAPASEDQRTAWALMVRANRWLRALRQRLAGNSGIAEQRPDRMHRLEKIDAIDALQLATPEEAPLGSRRRARAAVGSAESLLEKPPLELMEGICADLARAAELLGNTATARYVAEIAEAARALLGGYATEVLAAWADVMVAAYEPAAATGPGAPDSG